MAMQDNAGHSQISEGEAMTVFVLIDTGIGSPVAVFAKPERRPTGLPQDATEIRFKEHESYFNREVIGEWHSATEGCYFILRAFEVIL